MSSWVVDCSFISALFLKEEASESIEKFFQGSDKQLLSPSLLWYEICNVLIVATRRKRITHNMVFEIGAVFDSFDIITCEVGPDFLKKSFELAVQYHLSAYDCAYLALALEKNAGLATLDKDLKKAAERAGVLVVELN